MHYRAGEVQRQHERSADIYTQQMVIVAADNAQEAVYRPA
jgi:hypothetical protein